MPQMISAPPSTPSADSILQPLVWTRTARRFSNIPPAAPRRWSRYERLSFSMLGYTWGILVIAVSALHFGNYDLDTRTSSTSGSHSGFYESAKALKPSVQGTRQPASQGGQP
ncbi:hypothetical protein [Pseudomonas sp.]|uniref:hypothetical protein n=1 Tax=Pseudomonas sp. TaxID=306 RepID=UPI003D6E5B9D